MIIRNKNNTNYQLVKKSNKLTKIIIQFISFLSFFIVLLNSSYAPTGYNWLCLLPLCYGLLYSISYLNTIMYRFIGFTVMNFIMLGRYVVLPLYSSVYGVYYHSRALETTAISVNIGAVMLMIYEMICLFIVIQVIAQKIDNKYKYIGHDTTNLKNNLVLIIAIFIGVISLVLVSNIQSRLNFVIINKYEAFDMSLLPFIGYLFAISIQSLLFIIVVKDQLFKKFAGKKVNYRVIYLFAFINTTLIWTTNRLTLVAQALATALLIVTAFPEKKKSILVLTAITITIITISVTGYRLFDDGGVSNFSRNAQEYFDVQETENNLQAYFGGHHLISIAIMGRMEYHSLIGFKTFLNDLLRGIIGIKQLDFIINDLGNTTTQYFNNYFGFSNVTTMLLPTLGQGYMYFGAIGAPIFSIIFCLLLCWVEKLTINSKDIALKYCYYVFSIWLAFFQMQNITIVNQTIFNVFMPLFLIVYTNTKFLLKKHYN